jgi:exonuclease III
MMKRFPKYKYFYWSSCKVRGGYSGTAFLCKKKPINCIYGLINGNENLISEEE